MPNDQIYAFAKQAAEAATNKKGYDVILMDMRELTPMTDYFVVVSADVDVQVKAITDEIRAQLAPEIKPWHIEGYQHLEWVLLDYIDFVVHVFKKGTREYYNIEDLWSEASVEEISSESPPD